MSENISKLNFSFPISIKFDARYLLKDFARRLPPIINIFFFIFLSPLVKRGLKDSYLIRKTHPDST